ncbi:MAG: hypothetical protein PHH54_06420 [Candidatus Nanoarchaeia archaeon]|nr:hypothetical protein [Candidatus Nanoarchaeia archaeon]MDD5741590.1 hypothetical protein [Candidatus Nanoarchaeia archaeon]
MTLESKAISTESMKYKLRNLGKFLPGRQGMVYDFGVFLAGKLPERIIPPGFVMAAMLSLDGLEKGVYGGIPEPVISSAVGYKPQFYNALRSEIPDIFDAVCPEDFADDAKNFYEQIIKDMKEAD